MNVPSELVSAAADTPDVSNIHRLTISVSDASHSSSSSGSVEHCAGESVQSQPTVLPHMGEEISPAADEIPVENATGKSEVENADVADVNSVHASAVISSELTSMDMSEQLAGLHNTVSSLRTSNDELRQIVSDGLTKVRELEAACAKSEARNRELEKELSRLRGSSERTVSDVALLSTSLGQISVRVDKLADVNSASAAGEGSAATADMSSLEPTAEQRVAELELKLQQSTTRFGEFASALNSIERDLQRYIRRLSLVVENLCPKEDRSASDAFLIFVNSVLGIAIDDSDIDGLHLLDRTNEDGATATKTNSPEIKKDKKDFRPRPILITFTCYRIRTQVYKAWLCHRVGAAGGGKAAAGSLSGERGHGVCIREYLTPSQETIYRKADETRHKRPDVIMDCWTFRGRTFVRTSQGEVCEFNDADQFCTKDTKTSSCVVM